jgi:xylulokinase
MADLVAGVDTSTQSCKGVVRDAASGALVREGRAAHPDGTEVAPSAWADALRAAIADAGGLADVRAIGIGGQQHGMVLLDEDGAVVRDALLWNDTRSASSADALGEELGAAAGAAATGSVPVASFTVTKLRWVGEHEPDVAARASAVCLPHDWLTAVLRTPSGPAGSSAGASSTSASSAGGSSTSASSVGRSSTSASSAGGSGSAGSLVGRSESAALSVGRSGSAALSVGGSSSARSSAPGPRVDVTSLTTDRGDASGTGYWSPSTGDYRLDLLERAFGRGLAVPRLAAAYEVVGEVDPSWGAAPGAVLAPGTGDNMAAALGLDAQPGDVVVSLGTSGTAFAVSRTATHDESGAVAGFADASGAFLPLVCTLNAAQVLDVVRRLLGVDHAAFDALALSAAPGAGGVTLLPYLAGERTPNRPDATGVLSGLTLANGTPDNLARAAVEGMLCGLADAIDALVALAVPVERVILIGGAARSAAVAQIAPQIFGRPVLVADPGEYVADGAARQAARTLLRSSTSGVSNGPAAQAAPELGWPDVAGRWVHADPTPHVRDAYAHLRDTRP